MYEKHDHGMDGEYDRLHPGMREWAKFQTNDEMVAACQIPENILNTMSTQGLVETCLNYPLLGDMIFS